MQLSGIPLGWTAEPLKYIASINDEALSEDTPPDFVFQYVDIGSVDHIDGIRGTEVMVFEKAPSRARRIVRQGDTIVSTVRTYLRAIAPIDRPSSNLIVSTGFAVVRPRSIEAGYLSYALREQRFIEEVVARSVGVSYPAIRPTEVGQITVLVPPLDEQRDIAAFLDAETAKLDTLIEKKRVLIELLKEQRSALISRTVTRGLPPDAARAAGLDPHPEMKDSGIEWLGEVPAHWGASSVRYAASDIIDCPHERLYMRRTANMWSSELRMLIQATST
jgi:type I restriction enzyme S subunit